MVKAMMLASLVSVATAGGKLALTWEDCGDASTHGKTDSVEPSEVLVGQDTTITGSGSTDKQITSGTFEMDLAASMGIKKTYTGKICEPASFEMPLNIGTVSWAGMDCPVAVGPSKVVLGVKLASILPAALAKADLALTALDQDGEQAVCVNTHLQKEESSFPDIVDAVVGGGKLALTWEDCGDASTHGKTDSVEPSEVLVGQDTTITGSGSTDKQITSGTFEMDLAASMGIKKTYTGKICEPATFKMPLNIGTVSWAGMDCPVAVGPSKVVLGVKLASILPAALAKADLSLTALDQDGEQAVCVNTHLQKEVDAVV